MTSVAVRGGDLAHVREPGRAGQSPSAPWVLLGAGAVIAVLLLQVKSVVPFGVRLEAAALWMLYLVPAAVYAGRRRATRPPLPTLAILGFAHATFYALPPLAGIVNAAYLPAPWNTIPWVDPAWDVPAALDLNLWGWLSLLAGYALSSMFLRERPLRPQALDVRRMVGALWIIASLGPLVEGLGAVMHLPVVLAGTLGFGKVAGRYALTVLLALRTRGELPRGHGKYLAAAIVIEMVLLATTGSMANPMMFGLTLSFGFWIAGGRLRPRFVAAVLVSILIAVILKGVADDYRRRAWWVSEQLTQAQRTVVMSELLQDQLATEGLGGSIITGAQASMRRSATLDLLADVMRRTPREIPYWRGQTYYTLLGAFVPRFLWPTKPTKTLGNQFGHRYGYIGTNDRWTEVNMPYLLEFYANFGFIGVIIGMFITGIIVRTLDVVLNRPGSSIFRATAALVIIQPIFLIESDFSLVFGGLILNGVAMLMLVRFLEKRGLSRNERVPVRSPDHLRVRAG